MAANFGTLAGMIVVGTLFLHLCTSASMRKRFDRWESNANELVELLVLLVWLALLLIVVGLFFIGAVGMFAQLGHWLLTPPGM